MSEPPSAVNTQENNAGAGAQPGDPQNPDFVLKNKNVLQHKNPKGKQPHFDSADWAMEKDKAKNG